MALARSRAPNCGRPLTVRGPPVAAVALQNRYDAGAPSWIDFCASALSPFSVLRFSLTSHPDSVSMRLAIRVLRRSVIAVLVASPLGAQAPATPPTTQPAAVSKLWYERLSLRGYAQIRYNRLFESNSALVCAQCDRSIGNNGGFFLRRGRIILSGNLVGTAVQSYLTSKGIPGGVITTKAFGEGAPRVETADGVRELQNRRVEIQYGPGSGM